MRHYHQAAIESANGVQLIVALYDGLHRFLTQAAVACELGDVAARREAARRAAERIRERLAELGVEVRFHARVDDLLVADGRVVGVRLADGAEERASHVIVAPGHSARDTVRMLVRRGAAAVPRPIAVGARVEHPQALIDRARYGADERGELPAASYRLAWNPPRGAKARMSSSLMSNGWISQYTPISRTRRAISWVYWEPKSRIRIR